MRRRIISLLAASALTCACGCFDAVESSGKTARPASCGECHPYAGTKYCDTSTVSYSGRSMTRCSFCHLGSVLQDSTLNLYHDRMLQTGEEFLPVTGKTHANRSVDVVFGQCDMCHDYPPRLMSNPGAQYAHNTHVLLDGMQCCDCHLSSVRCSTDRHPDPSNPADTVDTLVQVMRYGIGGQIIPVADGRAHLNNRVDISFRKRAEDSINYGAASVESLYIWDSFTKDCYNMKGCGCHIWLSKKSGR